MTHEIAALREALQNLENACEQLAATRTHEVYAAMIDSGQAQPLLALDSARRAARQALAALEAPAVDQGAPIATVDMVEMVSYAKGYAEDADPIWRIEIGGICADFEHSTAANNFALVVNDAAEALAATRESAAVERERERCAAMASQWAAQFKPCVRLGDDDSIWLSAEDEAAKQVLLNIAAAIRAGEA